MKKNTIIIGIVLLAIGTIIYFIGVDEYESTQRRDQVEEMLKSFGGDPDKYDSALAFWSMFTAIGFLLIIIGIIVCLAGFVQKEKNLNKSERFCPGCGRPLDMEYQICPYCGRDFRIKKWKNNSYWL